jgi:hypothetical protein
MYAKSAISGAVDFIFGQYSPSCKLSVVGRSVATLFSDRFLSRLFSSLADFYSLSFEALSFICSN